MGSISLKVIIVTLFVFLTCLMPFVSSPTDANAFYEGDGTVGNPFVITNLEQLNQTRHHLSSNFMLANNIDASETENWDGGKGFQPIGNDTDPINGIFDGNGHIISGLFVNHSYTDNVGLFGYTSVTAVIKNIGLEDVGISGENNVGGLVGFNRGTITQSYATGDVSGEDTVGGLVGCNEGHITQSYATGYVTGEFDVGGFVGFNTGTITQSYATGDVNGNDYVGGLVGYNFKSAISQSYATGEVSGNDNVGGLVGMVTGPVANRGTVNNSYATGDVSGVNDVGGLVGDNTGTIDQSHWDTQTSSQITSDGGTGNTTEEMMQQTTFVGWDFDNVWWMVDGETRPFLRMEWSTEIRNSHHLQMMAMNLSADYVLMNDIDLVDVKRNKSMWGTDASEGRGFHPIGYGHNAFNGTLDGNGHIISDLFINRTSTNYVGLFGSTTGTAEIKNIGLVDVDVSANSRVGALVGDNYGTIDQSYATGDVSGFNNVGGLVGYNEDGTISQSYATSDVGGRDYVGGLVGYNYVITISQSYATGNVSGEYNVGGLVGYNDDGNIIQSYATGDVSDVDYVGGYVGGLVGYNTGTIGQSYSTSYVSGNKEVGGLVGVNEGGTISQSYATGDVSGEGRLGGLVGYNDGTISQSYATGDVNGNLDVGGFVGVNEGGTITQSYWDTQTSNQISSAGGEGKTTEEMMLHSTFVDWNFDDVWWIAEGATHPLLQQFVNFTVAALSIDQQPELTYDYGDELDLTLLKVNMTWIDGSVVINSAVEHKDFLFYKLETNPSNGTVLDHTYDGVTVEVTHTSSNEKVDTSEIVINRIVTAFWVIQEPDVMVYDLNQALDLSGLRVNLTWSETGNETIVYADFAAKGIVTDPSHGQELSHDNGTVTVTHTASGESDSFEITVNAIVIEVLITQQPHLDYDYGQELDISDLRVTLRWSNGTSTEDIAPNNFDANGLVAYPATISSINHSHDGSKVTVTHTVSGQTNHTSDLAVTTIVTAIDIEVQPLLLYDHGDMLDLSAMIANMTWSDGTWSSVTFGDFGANDLNVSIANGTYLTELDHHGLIIEVTHVPTGLSYDIEALSVLEEAISEPIEDGGDENNEDDICAVPFALMLIIGMSVIATRKR